MSTDISFRVNSIDEHPRRAGRAWADVVVIPPGDLSQPESGLTTTSCVSPNRRTSHRSNFQVTGQIASAATQAADDSHLSPRLPLKPWRWATPEDVRTSP